MRSHPAKLRSRNCLAIEEERHMKFIRRFIKDFIEGAIAMKPKKFKEYDEYALRASNVLPWLFEWFAFLNLVVVVPLCVIGIVLISVVLLYVLIF